MRAKPSSTASGMQSFSGPFTVPLPIRTTAWAVGRLAPEISRHPGFHPGPGVAEGAGLSHDARNLMAALGLYCDLLAMPGVLSEAHAHYADELRLIATRSVRLVDRLLAQSGNVAGGPIKAQPAALNVRQKIGGAPAGGPPTAAAGGTGTVRLREIVERFSGLLTGIAGGREVEFRYGPAASLPVRIPEEDVERILVNLVRNAAAAVAGRESGRQTCPPYRRHTDALHAGQECPAAAGAIQIAVGYVFNRRSDSQPWACRRVRITVEDLGCGMTAEQMERLLRTTRANSRGSGGIGLRVVQELVIASQGDMRIVSEPGQGCCVQLEWPVAEALDPPDGVESDASRQSEGGARPSAERGTARLTDAHANEDRGCIAC
jgi:signal transduction histidine kinase